MEYFIFLKTDSIAVFLELSILLDPYLTYLKLFYYKQHLIFIDLKAKSQCVWITFHQSLLILRFFY